MSDSPHLLVVDLQSGTVFYLDNAVIVDPIDLDGEDAELFCESDADTIEISKAYGTKISASAIADARALDAVAALLNEQQWSSDHLEAVAEMIRATGREINDI